MHRFLSAVVVASALALLPRDVVAQPAAAAPPGPAKPPVLPKPPAPAKAAAPAPAKAAAPAPKPTITPTPAPTGGETQRKPDDRLSDEAELARVVGLYEAGKYRECSEQIEHLLDPIGKAPLRQPAIVENARVYWSACLLGAGAGDAAAEAPLRAAIHENPQMKPPDSLVFPQPVVQRFLKVRDSLVNEIRAAEQARIEQAQAEARQRERRLELERTRTRALEQLAQQESVVVQNRRVLAFVPFGVGQLQNRQEALGYTLMASEVLLGGFSIAAVAVQSQLAATAEQQRREGRFVDEEQQQSQQSAWGYARTISFWGFAALALGGVLQANLEYVPEFRETRKRPLPPELETPSPRKAASLMYLPYADAHGAGLNVVGSF
jgi:hypothetical protein